MIMYSYILCLQLCFKNIPFDFASLPLHYPMSSRCQASLRRISSLLAPANAGNKAVQVNSWAAWTSGKLLPTYLPATQVAFWKNWARLTMAALKCHSSGHPMLATVVIKSMLGAVLEQIVSVIQAGDDLVHKQLDRIWAFHLNRHIPKRL